MSIETTELNTDLLAGGRSVTGQKTLSNGNYFQGQLLGRTDATGVYGPYNSGGAGGLEKVRGIAMTTVTIATGVEMDVYISGSELQQRGIVDSAGAKLAITKAIIESAQDAGIILKK